PIMLFFLLFYYIELTLKYLLVAVSLLLLLTGCAKTVYVPVHESRTEYRDLYHRDSIHILDSVFLKEKGDTVFLSRWRIQYVDRLKRDSVIVRDNIRVPYPVEVAKLVEKELNFWQKLRIYLGNIVLLAGVAWLGSIIIKNKFNISR
ncbi:MAG: hypothetical protein LUH22_08665, partial [Bacteroides sp.]|nr:hypothetical protein [Bacteroides sp.]